MAKTILIVDDSPSLRLIVNSILTEAGYEIIEAGNGQEALALLDGRKIHLILSDVNMPVMDGISFIKAAKQLPHYKFTPIIMLTTEAGGELKKQGQQAGARAWMIKPFKAPRLLSAVSTLALP